MFISNRYTSLSASGGFFHQGLVINAESQRWSQISESLASGKQRRGLDLVLYLPFDGAQGKTTKDLSRFRNHAQLEGRVDWRKGKFGKALYFCRELACGREPGLVRTPQHEIFAFEAGDEITLMAWINVEPANVGGKLVGARAIIYNRPRNTQANYGLRMDRVDPSFFIVTMKMWTFIVLQGYGTLYR